MTHHLHIDFETFSEADIRDVGAYRYCFDESAEILMMGVAFGDDEPFICLPTEPLPEEVWWALNDPDVLIYAFHAAFEMAMCQSRLKKTWGVDCPPLSRFRCVQSLARRAALPSKLEKLGEVLNLKAQKSNRGKALIKKFSIMQKPKKASKKNPNGVPARRILPSEEPEAFLEFQEYCLQDVRAEREASHLLAYFDDPINNANYSLDAVINARGVPVNLTALRHAQTLIEEETEMVSEAFRKLTGFEVTQNARLLKWINDGPLFKFDNLQAETLDAFLETYEHHTIVPKEVEALRMKQSIAYASIKKVATMLACAGPHDNRIRGMLNHHGATTGRWTASLVQFQNMKRATVKESEQAYANICAGVGREMMELTYGPVMEVIASCIRHFVHDVDTPKCPVCGAAPFQCGHGNFENISEG